MKRKTNLGRSRIGACLGISGGVAVTGITLAAFAAVAPLKQEEQMRKTTAAPVANKGKYCSELFTTIGRGDAKGLEDLLQKGGDPNSRNGLEFTPLAMAAATHQSNMVDILLKAGAKLDASSPYGTALTFASMTGNVPDAMKFISMGADPDHMRNDGLTPLAMASNIDCVPLMQGLIDKKVKVDNQDDGGVTALGLCARNGFADGAKTLIDAGANVNIADVDGQTPLMMAAMNGRANVIKVLLANGAKVNATDTSGRTALMLAANYGDNADAVKALLEGGANAKAKDAKGRTAGQLAAMHGYAGAAKALGVKVAVKPGRTSSDAVRKSLKLIATSTQSFDEATTCVSCHQEGLGRIATGEAIAKGFRVDPGILRAQAGRINGMVAAMKPLHDGALNSPEVMKQVPLIEIDEVSTMYSWILAGMAGQNQAPTPATASMAMVLAKQQAPDGSWTFALPRQPMQSSFFTFTAYAVQSLDKYAPKSASKEVAGRIANARKWLMTAKPMNSEDRASRLLGLKWAGQKDVRDAKQSIVKDQHGDGGWAQLPNMPSDAYATGQALYALKVGGGMSTSDPVYQRGVKFLLRTQDDDGSWYVVKRAMPANNYFDAGFPHGESQYASFNATCWATMALLKTVK